MKKLNLTIIKNKSPLNKILKKMLHSFITSSSSYDMLKLTFNDNKVFIYNKGYDDNNILTFDLFLNDKQYLINYEDMKGYTIKENLK